MAVRLRLARHGRKRQPYYYIVAADQKSPRDGRFIERIGSYNPNTNPATIELDFDKALDWYCKGAQPSDTVKRILSYKGILMKKHLLDGVKKGAFDEAEAEKRFNDWLSSKSSKINQKIDNLSKEKSDLEKARLEAEEKVNKARAEAIAKKYAAETAEPEAETEENTENVEETISEQAPEAQATEEKAEDNKTE